MMKRLILLPLILILNHASFSQCGTTITEEQMNFYKKRINIQKSNPQLDFSIIRVPLTIHIIRQSDGTGGLTEFAFESALDNLNSYYGNSGLEFFLPSEINYIDNDDYYDLSSNQEASIGFENDAFGTINVYFSNSLKSTQALCGYTYFPPSADRVFVANACISGGTFEHEIGHYFTLFHTHGTTNNGTTDELVDGSNCTAAGDRICDTPADPNLSGKVNATCQYTASVFDTNNDLYTPMISNIMSYAPGNCRTDFTAGQYERIRTGFENGRSYLNIETAEFEARFNANLREACEGDVIFFSQNTSLASAFKWTFEGGSPTTSTQPNPQVTYETEGTYSVTFEASAGTELQDIVVEEAYITIENPLKNSIADAYINEINSQSDLDDKFQVINDDLGITFTYSSQDASSDIASGSVMLENFNYVTETYPNTDILVGPTFEVSGVKGLQVSFDRAYAQQELSVSDSLAVVYRVDCDKEWTILEVLGGTTLKTVTDPISDAFQPTASEWSTFSSFYPIEDVNYLTLEIALLSKSYNGNNLFLDNINFVPDFSVDAPFNFRVSTIADGNFTFRWVDNSSNELAFVVEVSVDGIDYQTLESLEANSSTFVTPYGDLINDYNWIRLYAEGKNDNVSERTEALSLKQVLSVKEFNNQIAYHPNPFGNSINIEKNNDWDSEIRIYSLDGRLLKNMKMKSSTLSISTSDLKSGIYLMEIIDIENKIKLNKKIFKQ